jgi:hypothetical protein
MKRQLATTPPTAPAPATRAIEVGQKVLAGLAKGRAIAYANRAESQATRTATLLTLVNADRAAGRPARGLAGRLARKVGGSERHIRRIISDTLSRMSDWDR